MKKLFFSLLIALSFSLQAMEKEKKFNKNEYHKKITAFVKWFDSIHPRQVKYALFEPTKFEAKKTIHKIKLVRDGGKKSEDLLETIRNFDFKNSKKEDAPQGARQVAQYARFLDLVNKEFGCKI